MSNGYLVNTTLLIQARSGEPLYDGSWRGKSIMPMGNASVIGNLATPHGMGCIAFDGNSDYLMVGESGDVDLSASDAGSLGYTGFTLEFFAYANSLSTTVYLANRRQNLANDWVIMVDQGYLQAVVYGTGAISAHLQNVSVAFPIGQWVHVAITVDATTFRLFQNGVLIGSAELARPISNGEITVFGEHTTNSSRWFNGYMDQIRIVRQAIYIENFTPPSALYDEASFDMLSIKGLQASLIWANAETQAQAFPGQNHWAPLAANPPELAVPISQLPHLTTPPIRAELGYIAGVVTVKQVPAPGRTVRCFDPTMTLVAETVSDAGGHYRFDNLLRNRRYLILAQDTWEFNHAPVGADRRTPEAYP